LAQAVAFGQSLLPSISIGGMLNLRQFQPKTLTRPKIGSLFCGLDVWGESAAAAEQTVQIVNVVEFDEGICEYLTWRFGRDVKATNILTMDMKDLVQCDILEAWQFRMLRLTADPQE
jgi:hypothetical protein